MTGGLITVATAAAAVASAVVAGVTFAFSTSVMPALARRPAPEAIAAMQAINAAILNPAFRLAFGGAALVCTALALAAPFTVAVPHALLRGSGAALYAAGSFGVTIAINVPMNAELDSVHADRPEAREIWNRYLTRWTAWNTARTVLGAGASVLLTASLA